MTRLYKILYKLFRRDFFFYPLIIIAVTGPVNAQSSKYAAKAATGVQENFTSFTPQKFYSDRTKLLLLTPTKYTANPDFGKSFVDNHFEDSTQWYERIDKRTLKSRSYIDINNPAKILLQYGYDNLNYVDGYGWLRAVDLKLTPSANGWSAAQQEIPVYLYPDGSTALSLGHGQVMTFNKNVTFNNSSISTTDYTVGDNGMYIKNAVTNTDKIIRFGRGRIETDYSISKPLKLNGDLIISEDIVLPKGYTISENTDYYAGEDQPGSLVVKSADGKVAAELKAPLCYDNSKNSIVGSYQIKQQDGGYRVEVDIPSAWLNDSSRRYPITIDPVVTGPVSFWSGGVINSCLNTLNKDTGGMDTGTLYVTIPPSVTITGLIVQVCYYAPLLPGDSTSAWFTTPCTKEDTSKEVHTVAQPPLNTVSGLYWVLQPVNFLEPLIDSTFLSCFAPSCQPQIIPLTMALIRTAGGSGCNPTYMLYDPGNNDGYPYEAWVIGDSAKTNTDTLGAGWAVSPNPTCGNNCTLTLNITTIYGVPPYTITHPWASGSLTYGRYDDTTAVSSGTVNLPLTIPGCPEPVCNTTSIIVPAPVVVDACGDTVQGLTPITVNLNPVPDVIITPSAATICSDSTISISLSTCVNGSTLAWKGSDGTSGSGGIVDAPVNNGALPDTVTYTVTSTSAAGCASSPAQIQVAVNPLPVISVSPPSPAICAGNSIELTAGGAVTYIWSPAAGLSSTTGDSVIANSPGSTYAVTGTGAYGCIGKASVTVGLAVPPVISVSPPASIVCIGANTTLTAQGASTYTWQPATGLNTTNDSSVTVTPTITITYTVTGINSSGCIDSTTVVITLGTLPKVSFFMTVPNTCDPQRVQFADTLPGGVSYLWDFGDGSTGASSNPFHTYIAPGSYKVKLTVTDSQGCMDSASANDTIIAVGYVAVPNAFAPEANNGDVYFTPHVLCMDYSGYTFNVYSRWGQLLFQTDDANQGWDGRYNGVAEPVGVYIYYVQFNCGNCPLIKKGNITLLK